MKPRVRIALLGLAASLMGLFCVVTARTQVVAPLETLRGKDVWDFANNTQNYKGKTLTMRLVFFAPRSGRRDVPDLLSFSNGDSESAATVRFSVDILVQPAENPPNAKQGDSMWVTFVCADGHLKKGNKAVQIKK